MQTEAGPTKIKQERVSEAEQAEAEYKMFCDGLTDRLRFFQNMQVVNQEMLAGLSGIKYTSDICAEVSRLAARIASVIKLLLRAKSEAPTRSGWKKLARAMDSIEMMHRDLEESAAKFGVVLKSKSRRVRRRTE